MASEPVDTSPYLRKPLYVYDLPPELLHTLELQTNGVSLQQLKDESEKEKQSENRALNEDGVSTSTSCGLCKATFRDVSEQRQHVRSDYHRYNLKLKLKGLPPIDEATFIKQIGDLDESISGSESSESESEDESHKSDTLSSLLKKQAKISEEDDDSFVVSKHKRGAGSAPLLWLRSPKLPQDIGLGVFRALLSDTEQEEAPLHLVDIIKRKQVAPVQAKHSGNAQNNGLQNSSPHFFLCMIGGGHFAAAIISLAPEIRKGPGGAEERHAVVMAHKTFHRYTTRRKQGGAQSANDNAKGNAHSVGSNIRRANEAALMLDIRNLLTDWKSMIDSAELVFIRATGSQNRRTLFGPYEGQVLTSKDRRIRGFPFSTRRATQNELMRAFQELTRVKVSTMKETSEDKHSSETQQAKQTPKPKPVAPKLSPEEEAAQLHTSQLQNLIRRSKAPGVLLYLNKNSVSPNFEFHPPDHGSNHHSPTALHLAASTNAAAVVTALLTKAGADPSIKNSEGKTPYDIAGDFRTRDAFRVARYQLGEEAFDWIASHVPAGLSPEEADAKSKREQDESQSAESQRRKAELERIRHEEEQNKIGKLEQKAGAGKTLGALPEKTWTEKREQEARGLTPEMRQRLERERRARAAEARFKTMSGNR